MRASADDKQMALAVIPSDQDGFDQDDQPKPKKPKIKVKKPDPIDLPILVEIAFTFSGIMLVLVALTVAGVSFVSGAAPLDIFFRTLVATIAMGGILWLFSWQFSTGVLQGALLALQEEDAKKEAEREEQIRAEMEEMQPEPLVKEG